MKVVLTLVVRDEADVVAEQIRYHLEAGVDFVVATDHRSTDGTTEILRGFERDGVLRLIRREAEAFFQSEWVTEMARLAAVEHGADWVINADADEFWWPREGALREVLAAVPPRLGVVRGVWRHFVLRPEDGTAFHERLVVRRRPVLDPAHPYHAQLKVAHRGVPDVVVPQGNHDARGAGLTLVREWFPFEVLHFPVRRRDQLERKFVAADEAYRLAGGPHPVRHIRAVAGEIGRRSADDVYRSLLVDDEALARGLEDGSLELDTRLRDRLARRDPSPRPTLGDDAALAGELDVLLERDAARALVRRADGLERRLAELERTRVASALRRKR